MTKLSLTYNERINIIQFFPKESDLLEQITGATILKKTKVSREVLNGLKTDIYGTIEDEGEQEFEFDNAEINLLKSGFDKLKTDKKITQATVSLCVKLRDINIPAGK